jgi:FkbM family methyltransferase
MEDLAQQDMIETIHHPKPVILYGANDNFRDVTSKSESLLMANDIIYIPSHDDVRAHYFGDHMYGTLKTVVILYTVDGVQARMECTHLQEGYVDITNNKVYVNNAPEEIKNQCNTWEHKLRAIHRCYLLSGGSFYYEYPEQLMVIKHLTGKEKVLEIGANIGRNTMVIHHMIKDTAENNFVTMECDPNTAKTLMYNRDINNVSFFVEAAALSKRKLIQKGWDTIASEEVLEGYVPVKTITWEQLNKKYNIAFDTLVLDCEGAFYYILMDMPEVLDNINMIIVENDYKDIEHKKYVDNMLLERGFAVVHSEAGGWGPCQPFFFQVWKKPEGMGTVSAVQMVDSEITA